MSRNTTTALSLFAEDVRDPARSVITLEEWKRLQPAEQARLLVSRWPYKTHLNKQDNDSIEWARWSWNPVTGCEHNCPYCYARDFAERFYPQGFVPTIHLDRFSAPYRKVPLEAATDISFRNIITCSMADLFGQWVPKEWIEAV